MSLADYEDFFYRACLCDRDDPVEAWHEQSEETRRLAEWITGKEEIHIEGPGTDIKLNISGRTFIAADGRHNMPDGEFFTGPVEDSATGHVTFTYPAVYGGREVAGVKLRFEDGKIVDASAERNEDFLIKTLDTDPRRAPPRRARDRHELRDRPLHQGDPARREDRRHGAPRGRHVVSRDRRQERLRRALGHGVRPAAAAGRITVDGQPLQVDGKFAV